MEHKNIEMWAPDLNPFIDPTADLIDTSQDALSRSRAHFTRVLLSWWKAANYVQSKETELLYQRRICNEVQSPQGLLFRPPGLTGISKDVDDAKQKPNIAIEYRSDLNPPPTADKRNTKPQLPSLVTGGTMPPNLDTKRLRQSQETEPNMADNHAQKQTQPGTTPTLPAEQPMHKSPKPTHATAQTAHKPLAYLSTPAAARREPTGQKTHYSPEVTPEKRIPPAPTTPNHLQDTASGTKLLTEDPREAARTDGVDVYSG